MKKLNYTTVEYFQDIAKIKDLYRQKKFDGVLAPSRGGLTLGVKLSHEFNIPFGIIDYQTRDLHSEKINEPILCIDPGLKDMKNILIVDEIADSGKTLRDINTYLLKEFPNVEITTLSIFGKEEFKKNYKWDYLRELDGRWIIFNIWEKPNSDFCNTCSYGEPCNKDSKNMIHCNIQDKSFQKYHLCPVYKIKG